MCVYVCRVLRHLQLVMGQVGIDQGVHLIDVNRDRERQTDREGGERERQTDRQTDRQTELDSPPDHYGPGWGRPGCTPYRCC